MNNGYLILKITLEKSITHCKTLYLKIFIKKGEGEGIAFTYNEYLILNIVRKNQLIDLKKLSA